MKFIQLLAYILIISTVLCWWEGGHMITVEIAKQEIVGSDPALYKKIERFVTILNPLCDARSQTFVEAASWADDIKDSAMNFWDKWHFFNKPINNDGLYIVLDQDSLTDNSINAIKRAVQELSKNNTIPINNSDNISLQQSILMRYLIHIVGDVHQPLHNTNFFNYTYSTNQGDLGGNKEKLLLLNGTEMLLHSYFDSGALRLSEFPRPLNASLIQSISDYAIQFRTQFPRSSFGDRMNVKTPDIWAQESYDIAQKFIYPYLDKTRQVQTDFDNQAYELIKQQIALGGYRLADLLISIFKPTPTPTEQAQTMSNSTEATSPKTPSTNFLKKIIQ